MDYIACVVIETGIFFVIFCKYFFPSSLIHNEREGERGRSIRSTWKDSRYVNIILAFRSCSARTNCSNDQSNVFEGRSYLFLKHHGRETTRGTERGCA